MRWVVPSVRLVHARAVMLIDTNAAVLPKHALAARGPDIS